MTWLADIMRDVIRDDAVACFVPDEPNFVRVRFTGGVKNRVGEYTKAQRNELPFAAVETTERGELDDLERRETFVGGQKQGEIVIMTLDPLLEESDRVERYDNVAGASTGEPWKVVQVHEPRLNDAVVAHIYTIRRQTD